EFQRKLPTKKQITSWYGEGNPNEYGIAVIGGRGSGNLEKLDWDSWEGVIQFSKMAETTAEIRAINHTMTSLLTPSRGAHFYYRCEGAIPGNTMLARGKDRQVIAETRGEGGYAVTAPTPGYGSPQGRLIDLPTLTQQEREALLRYARSFNEY